MSHETFRTCRSKPLHRKFVITCHAALSARTLSATIFVIILAAWLKNLFPHHPPWRTRTRRRRRQRLYQPPARRTARPRSCLACGRHADGTTDGASFKRAAWADLPIEVPSTDLVRPTDLVLPDIRNLIAELEASRDAVACGRWTMEDKCLLLSIMTRERAALMCRTLGMSGKGSRKQLIDRLAGSTFFQGWY